MRRYYLINLFRGLSIIPFLLLSFNVFGQKSEQDIVKIYQEKIFLAPIISGEPSKEVLHASENYYWFRGITRNGVTGIESIEHPELILGFLMGQNINVEEAWYSAPLPRCDMMDVIVPSSLIIRVRNRNQGELLKSFGFVKAETSINLNNRCSNSYVIHYDFRQSKK